MWPIGSDFRLRADLFPSSNVVLTLTLSVSYLCFLKFCVSIYFLQDDPEPFASLYCQVALHIFVLGVLLGRLSAFVLAFALPVDAVDKSSQNLPTAYIGVVSVECTLLPVGVDAKSVVVSAISAAC